MEVPSTCKLLTRHTLITCTNYHLIIAVLYTPVRRIGHTVCSKHNHTAYATTTYTKHSTLLPNTCICNVFNRISIHRQEWRHRLSFVIGHVCLALFCLYFSHKLQIYDGRFTFNAYHYTVHLFLLTAIVCQFLPTLRRTCGR